MFPMRLFIDARDITNSTNGPCQHPNPVMWVYEISGQCIYNVKEEVGFILGLVSLFCWLAASLPQLHEN